MSSVFLSHTHADKPFVRRLAADLRRAGVRVWLDEAELQLGDSLVEKIRQGIDEMEYVAAVLSQASVNSSWVQRELDVAMNQEIEGRKVKVLPLILDNCELPGFLKGKLYADFRSIGDYNGSLSLLLRRLGIASGSIPSDSRSLFTLLNASLLSSDPDQFRRALIGFMSLPKGTSYGLVADVLGSIKSWQERSKGPPLEDLMYETVVDSFCEAGQTSLAALEYLKTIHRYFDRPMRRIASDVTSPVLAMRLAANLVLYTFGGYGDSSDAAATCMDSSFAIPFRAASLAILGQAAHVDAATALNAAAAKASNQPAAVQDAVLEGLDALSRRAAATQILPGLASLLSAKRISKPLRLRAAERFLEVLRELRPSGQSEWEPVAVKATELLSKQGRL